MSKIVILTAVILAMSLTGCAMLDRLLGEPNQVEAVAQGAKVVGGVATGAGQPWGWILVTVGSSLSTLGAIYRNWRNQTSAADKYKAIEVTTKAIVDAIEATSVLPAKEGTIGDLVKAEVKAKLSEKDWYKVGKSIINGLKSS